MPAKIVTPEEWRAARLALLEKEMAHSRATDDLAAEVRALPMVPVTKNYTFHASDGSTKTLKDFFGKKTQLIVYHFMFEPTADEGCRGCSFMADNFPDLRHLAAKDTAFVAISRASIAKIDVFKKTVGYEFPWFSSEGSDFNYDFNVTMDENVKPIEYNYMTKEQLIDRGQEYSVSGEQPGFSIFKLQDGEVYQTYTNFSRIDNLIGVFVYLDMTPAGRQLGSMGPAEFKRRNEYGLEDE